MGSILETINTAPIYETTIPSTGKKANYRPYTVAEEQKLLMVKESKDLKLMINNAKLLISDCFLGNVDPEKLAAFDIEYLFLVLRSKSVSEEIEITLRCLNEDCKGSTDMVINIDDIKPPKVIKDGNIVKLNEKVSLIMHYPGFDTLEKFTDSEASTFTIVAELIDSIVNNEEVYNASDFQIEELEAFISNMNTKTLNKIIEFVQNAPKIEHKVKAKCLKCGKENTYTFRGLKNFFV